MGAGSPMVCRLARAFGVRDTRHGGALASARLAAILALEVPLPIRTPASQPRAAGADRHHVPREPTLGTERIRGELLKLGIVVSTRSIRRYRWRGPSRAPSQTWRAFLRNHAHHLWATDLFTVPTLTFKTLYVLVFIAHGRRELVHVNLTANPTAAWVWRQVIASRGICCAIEMPSTAATSAGGPDASVSTPSPRPFDRLVRTQLPNALSGHSAKNVWTT